MDNKVTVITTDLLNELLEQAQKSERKRVMRLLHEAEWEHMHRMLNALAKDTYITPHKHNDKHNAEGFIILLGKVAVLIFNDKGEIDIVRSVILEPRAKNIGIDVKPNTWHTVVALDDSVIYEVKGEPNEGYVEENAKDFAPWAPKEGTPESAKYLKSLFDKINMLQ